MAHVKGNSFAYINSGAYGSIHMKPTSLQALYPTAKKRNLAKIPTGAVLGTRTAAVTGFGRDAEEHLHIASRVSCCLACAAHAGAAADGVRRLVGGS